MPLITDGVAHRDIIKVGQELGLIQPELALGHPGLKVHSGNRADRAPTSTTAEKQVDFRTQNSDRGGVKNARSETPRVTHFDSYLVLFFISGTVKNTLTVDQLSKLT